MQYNLFFSLIAVFAVIGFGSAYAQPLPQEGDTVYIIAFPEKLGIDADDITGAQTAVFGDGDEYAVLPMAAESDDGEKPNYPADPDYAGCPWCQSQFYTHFGWFLWYCKTCTQWFLFVPVEDPIVYDPKNPDEGDPLFFRIDGGESCTYRAYPDEMHPTRIQSFDLYSVNHEVTLSRIMCDGTLTMGLDINKDGKITNGLEWGFSETENIYDKMKQLDTNNNGFFDYADDSWHMLTVQDSLGHTVNTDEILGFAYKDHATTFNDMHGNGRYADCIYEGEKFYDFCNEVSTKSGFRITAYHEQGVITKHGAYPSYGGLMGYLS